MIHVGMRGGRKALWDKRGAPKLRLARRGKVELGRKAQDVGQACSRGHARHRARCKAPVWKDCSLEACKQAQATADSWSEGESGHADLIT